MEHHGALTMRVALAILLVTTFLTQVLASHNHGSHHVHPSSSSVSARNESETSREAAAAAVEAALASLGLLNKARIENPHFNSYTLKSGDDTADPAPSINISAATEDGITRRFRRRQENSTVDEVDTSYSISPELAQAAKVMAESTPQIPSGNHSDVAAAMKEKYAHSTNDTNVPQSHKTPEGRLSVYGDDGDRTNGTANVKRADEWWMVGMASNGKSPHAPDDYKVWRNVKDYGAKGDGVTDDTEAINRAVSEGGRCGANCGSSTVYPAVVYFPPGVYLVSSPIIQYFNTEFLGDPLNMPTLLAASSFVGQGVITSDVYVSDNSEWYLNTANFLRSVRNFKIDIRPASPWSYICAIHWQVAQATSLENLDIYMLYDSDVPGHKQQGIYMENGSGGYLADIIFVGGHFGAYFGNQQFTTSHLIFVNSVIGLQVHWDWAWTMQDFIFESCTTGLLVVGGAGGSMSNGQNLGSLVLVDSIIANTPRAIVTTLSSDSSTSFYLQNVGFFNTEVAVTDDSTGNALLAGGNQVVVDSWGFGRVIDNTDNTGETFFANGEYIATMDRNTALLGDAYNQMAPNFFTRRRPGYLDVASSKVMNVKTLGAVGDGVADDTNALNSILEGAANTSSVVFFPYGIYLVTDTLRVPLGSRIIGQVWPQIMGAGEKFSDESQPRAVVQVGKTGDVGIAEISNMMVTVRGATAGAVVIEWNVAESSLGAAGMWDTHVRVGGAAGSDLSLAQCPKQSGIVNPHCKAASLLMHLTPKSTAYLENVWLWAADHDLDDSSLGQIDVYSGRGLLVESEKAWLWGTSVEHSVLYQYQFSGAENVVMGMIQTESPYFQPVPLAPAPFTTGMFPNDPTFTNCVGASSPRCAVSWAVRIIDSSSLYMLGAGLYSWFDDYDQDCVSTGDCQERGFEIRESTDIWLYNLCTKAIQEMVSPLGSVPTYAKDNVNGFLSSILAWLHGSTQIVGHRDFPGFRVWTPGMLDKANGALLSESCRNALTEIIACDNRTESFQMPGLRSWLGTVEDTDSVCMDSCGESLQSWFDSVSIACDGRLINDALPTLLGGRIWTNWNQTCLKDPATGKYCGEIIDDFSLVSSIENMPRDELCSFCWIEHYAIPHRSQYSNYDEFLQSQLDYTASQCGEGDIDTSIPDSPFRTDESSTYCQSNYWYTTSDGDTCDSIAESNSVSSAALYQGNPDTIYNCSSIAAGTDLCMPASCELIWVVQPGDTCTSIEYNVTASTMSSVFGNIKKYNRWVDRDCKNLHAAGDAVFGHVVCLSPQNGLFSANASMPGDTTIPAANTGYANYISDPPEGATVAEGTTMNCGTWHIVAEDDTCGTIAFTSGTTIYIFMEVNPSVGTDIQSCTSQLVIGDAYCAVPHSAWEQVSE